MIQAAAVPASPGTVSPSRAFGQLYRKDLESLQFTLVLFTVLIGVWEAFLITRVEAWGPGLAFALSFVPLSFIPLWIIWDAIQSYRSEWASGTVYFMLSVPVPGWVQALSKLAAVMTSFTVQSVVALGGTWAIFNLTRRSAPEFAGIDALLRQLPGSYVWQVFLGLGAAYWLLALAVVVGFQAAYVASQLATRWQFLTLIAALVVEWWAQWRLGGLGHFVFGWVPDIRLSAFSVVGDQVRMLPGAFVLDTGPLLGWAAGLGLLFAATVWLLQDVTEVS